MSLLTYSSDREEGSLFGAVLLALCMFTTGGAGLVVEYVIATTTTFILGSSIVVFSLIIGVMLGAMGVSGWIQEKVGDNLLLEKFFAIEVTLALAGGFAPIGLFWAYGAMNEHFNLILYGWTVLIGLLIGLEIPVVMRIIDKLGIGLRVNLKYVFGADYLGAMTFMFVWVFWFLPNFPITEISFMVSGVNFIVALIAVVYFGLSDAFKNKLVVFGIAILTFLVLSYGYMHNRSWNVYLEQRLYDDPIIFQTTTQYQHLVLTENKKARCGTDIRLYINGNTQFGSCDEHIYHDNLVAPVMSLAVASPNVLILGGGDGLVLRDVLKYNPASVTLVDLDPAMVDLARDNPHLRTLNEDAFADARVLTPTTGGVSQEGGSFVSVNIGTGVYDANTGREETEHVADVRRMHIDAERFLQVTRGNYDVIIVDLPDPNSVELSKLYTDRFYRQLRKRLSRTGLVVVQSTSPIHAREVFLEIGRTMRFAGIENIPYHDNVPSFGEWGFWLGCASDQCSQKLLQQIENLDTFAIASKYLTPDRLRANLTFGQVDGIPFLESASSDRVNTAMDPTMFLRYEAAWLGY